MLYTGLQTHHTDRPPRTAQFLCTKFSYVLQYRCFNKTLHIPPNSTQSHRQTCSSFCMFGRLRPSPRAMASACIGKSGLLSLPITAAIGLQGCTRTAKVCDRRGVCGARADAYLGASCAQPFAHPQQRGSCLTTNFCLVPYRTRTAYSSQCAAGVLCQTFEV